MKRLVRRLHAASFVALLALFTLAIPGPARAALVMFDFDELALNSGNPCAASPCDYSSGALVSGGFVLDPGEADWAPNAEDWIGHYHITDGMADPWSGADNGSRYFVFDYYFDNSILNIYSTTGGVFGLRQFDLAEQVGEGPCDGDTPTQVLERDCGVTFIGHLADGGTISRTVILDDVTDGTGPLNDFETFTFDGQWNRLTMFSIVPNHSYLNPGLDNLVLRTTPEPSIPALLGLGLAGLAFVRRRKR